MESNRKHLSRLSNRLGFYSSLLCVVLFLVYTVCFIAILAVNPLFKWTNMADFAAYQLQYNQMYKYLGMLSMLLFGAVYIVLLNVLHDYAEDEKRILAKISICFGIVFDVLLSINYFVQISAIRFNIESGHTEGLEQFIQSNPSSVITSVNILAWSLFLGLSSLFIAPVFKGSRLEKVIKYAFAANGVIVLLGGAGYVLDIYILVFLCINFGMAVPLLTAVIALCILFTKQKARLPKVSLVKSKSTMD